MATTVRSAGLTRVRGTCPRTCPAFGHHGRFHAHDLPPRGRFDAECSLCGSLERHRLFVLSAQRHQLVGEKADVLTSPSYRKRITVSRRRCTSECSRRGMSLLTSDMGTARDEKPLRYPKTCFAAFAMHCACPSGCGECIRGRVLHVVIMVGSAHSGCRRGLMRSARAVSPSSAIGSWCLPIIAAL